VSYTNNICGTKTAFKVYLSLNIGIIIDLVSQFFEFVQFGLRIFGRFNLVSEFLEGSVSYSYFLKWFSLVSPVIF